MIHQADVCPCACVQWVRVLVLLCSLCGVEGLWTRDLGATRTLLALLQPFAAQVGFPPPSTRTETPVSVSL
jgi:hypothetical protein